MKPRLPGYLHPYRECLAIGTVCLALIVVAWLMTFERIGFERRIATENAVRSNSNLALALEEQTVRTLKQAEQALLFMEYEYEGDGEVVTLPKLIEDGVIDAAAFASMSIVDAEGRVLLTNGRPGTVNLADRDFFAFHRDDLSAATRVGLPVTGRMTGRPVITLSRRANRPDGTFNGVYILGVDPTHFLKGYERFDIGRDGVVQLVGRDGVARARLASGKAAFGVDMRSTSLVASAARAGSGNFISVGRHDGTARFQSWRTLKEYPLIVAVGTSVDEVFATAQEKEREHYLTAVGGTLVIALLGLGLALATVRRNRAAQALKASEAVHRATFEQAAVGVVHVGLDGAFLKVNRTCCEMLGYSEKELLARKFADVTHPDDIARSSAVAADSQAARKPVEFEKRYVRKDGAVVSALVSVAPVRPEDDKPAYFVTVMQNISDRKRAEARLLEQLEELRRFQKVTVDRELRMIELEAQLSELKHGTVA